MESFAHGIGARFSRRDVLRAAAVAPLAGLSLAPLGCTQSQISSPPLALGPPTVRVLLLENRPHVELSATTAPTMRVAAGPPQRVNLPAGASVPVQCTGSGWTVGDIGLAAGELIVESSAAGSVAIDGHNYRGNYRFIPRPNGKIDVVNDVDVDDYLLGVLAKEMFPNWHDQAYRAQAIAARTYSLSIARTSIAGAHYDLFADTRSQMYGGIAGESAKSRAAVDETRGWVLAYGPRGDARIFKAYYSSCCGGVTQSAAATFGEPPIEPLSEQNIGPRCAASPRFSWPPVVISKKEITRRVRIWGANHDAPERTIGDVARIDIAASNKFGRPSSFTVTDVRGYQYRLGCEDLRVAINTDATDGAKLNSSFCRPVNEPSVIRFTDGHGFGHGVGLCQWCIQQQAMAGVPYQQIVLDAFPKAQLVKAY